MSFFDALLVIAVLLGAATCWQAFVSRASLLDVVVLGAMFIWLPVWIPVAVLGCMIIAGFVMPGRRRSFGHGSRMFGWPHASHSHTHFHRSSWGGRRGRRR